jgi:hypothetical protein
LHNAGKLQDWITSLMSRDIRPTEEQRAVLEALVERVEIEATEEQSNTRERSEGEPLFDLVHGFPGTGKTELIFWIRELFEKQLGWTHGIQFVCLAFQNIMAANINGFTIHHWSGIPVQEGGGGSGTLNANKLSTKRQSLRFLLIDEVSMVAAQLMGQLESAISKVTRQRNGYKNRQNGSVRPFGGLNVLFFGDWWQIPPVAGTALFGNPDPSKYTSYTAYHGLSLLWGSPEMAVRKVRELTKPVRCSDAWYNAFLMQCRSGTLAENMYNFFHGFPTGLPTSVEDRRLPTEVQLLLVKASCSCDGSTKVVGHAEFYEPWKQRFLADGVTGYELVRNECAECHKERQRRRRVLNPSEEIKEEMRLPPLDTAPALFAYNVPRYYTVLLRSREYAKANGRRLSWCFSQDIPLHREDRDLPDEDLHAKRCKWLQRHDQDTSHIPSQLPLVVCKELALQLREE